MTDYEKRLSIQNHAQYIKHKVKVRARQDKYQLKRRMLRDQAKSKPCADCKQLFPLVCMDFDHREGTNKKGCIALLTSIPAMLLEIQKCDVVCSNCHRIRTYNRKNAAKLHRLLEAITPVHA